MGDMTKNFSRSEFACKGAACCDNSAPISAEHVEKLQALRTYIGLPLRVTSGFRCKKHNKTVGGSVTSQHILGLATDITCASLSAQELITKVVEFDTRTLDALDLVSDLGNFVFSGIGFYPDQNFIHLDSRAGEQHKWTTIDGCTTIGLAKGLEGNL